MNQKLKFLTMGLILSSSLLTACEPNNNTEKVVDRVHVTADDSMSSAELATAAEQLVGPYTFMLAYKTALKAVEKDPTNLKAQFYVNLLKRFEAFRGILTRVKPALNVEQLKNMNETIKKIPMSPLKEYLTEDGPPIKTVTEIQDVLANYTSALKDFRKFLKANQTAELNIYLNPYVFEKAIKEELKNSCTIKEGDGSVTVDCDYSQIATKKLNMADMIALTQMTSGEILVFGLYNNYSLQGIEKLTEVDPNHRFSQRETTNFLFSQPSFGKLRKDHIFSMLTEMGSDLSSATKWAIEYQNKLCPKGSSVENQRPGYLFSKGICIENVSDVQKGLAQLDSALHGAIRVDLKRANEEIVNTEMNFFAWSTSPIQDLRQIRPTTWSKCDKAVSFADNTFGGVFVDNNAPLFVKSDCSQ